MATKQNHGEVIRRAQEFLSLRPLSGRELSLLLGTTKVTAYRIVTKLKKLGAEIEEKMERQGIAGPESAVYKVLKPVPEQALPRIYSDDVERAAPKLDGFGEILRDDFMKPRGMTQGDLAQALRLTKDDAKKLTEGSLALDPDIIDRLAKTFKTSPSFWLRLAK